jgi:hypothetical protein
MKILLASLAAVCLAAAVPADASVAANPLNPQYRQCVQQNMQSCYPRDGNGNIYKPNPDTPEGEAFAQCSADVRDMCASLYP